MAGHGGRGVAVISLGLIGAPPPLQKPRSAAGWNRELMKAAPRSPAGVAVQWYARTDSFIPGGMNNAASSQGFPRGRPRGGRRRGGKGGGWKTSAQQGLG